jgi:hypothetical protein
MMAQREISVGIGQCRFSWRRQMVTAPLALVEARSNAQARLPISV